MSAFHTTYKTFASQIKTVRHVCRNNVRSISSTKRNSDLKLHLYSSEEQMQIIDTLHKCAQNNETRNHLNEKRLQGLKSLFEKYPNLKSLELLLTISGVGPKLLHRICDSILQPKQVQITDNVDTTSDTPTMTLSSSLITPGHIAQSRVENVISIQLGINTITWARLRTTEAELDTWGIMDLSEFVEKKFDIHSIWNLAMTLRDLIPNGDVYVMENANWSNVANIKKPMKFHIQEAMLTTAICSVFNQTDSGRESRTDTTNRMYYLRTFTPYRLYRKIVGSERVSAQDIVEGMIDGVADERHRPITFSPGTANKYRSVNGPDRDMLCQSLLLAVSFTELVLIQNPSALNFLGRSALYDKRRTNG